MSHKDEYGRTWKFKPGHDTAMMLQISPELLHAALQLRDLGADNYPLTSLREMDCYLLRSPLAFEQWYVGARFSDEGQDYLSPYLDPLLVEYMVKKHLQVAYMPEWRAIEAINKVYPPPGAEHEVWAVLAKRQDGGLPSPVKAMCVPRTQWVHNCKSTAVEAKEAVNSCLDGNYAGVYRCLLRVVSEVKPTKE